MRNLVSLCLAVCCVMTGCAAATPPAPPVSASSAVAVENSTGVAQPVSEVSQAVEAEPLPRKDASALSASERLRLQLYSGFIAASYLDELKQFEAASQSYLDALKMAPTSSYLSAAAGSALLQSGKTEEAIAVAEAALRAGSPTVEVCQVLGQAYTAQQRWDLAITQYQAILALQPDSFSALAELSLLYLRQNRFEEAIPLFRKMAGLDPYQSIFYQFKVATLLVQLNRLDEALQEYQAIAAQAPHLADIPIQIGAIYEAKQDYAKAAESYQTALGLITSPAQEVLVRNRLGLLLIQQKNLEEARKQFERIKQLDPTDPMVRKHLISLHLTENRLDEALTEAAALGEMAPGDYRIHLLLREIYVQNERGEEGYARFLAAFEQAVEGGKKADVNFFLLDVPQERFIENVEPFGFRAQVETLLQQSHTRFPDLPRVGFALAAYGMATHTEKMVQQGMESVLAVMDTIQEATQEELCSELCFEFFVWYKVRFAFIGTPLNPRLEEGLQRCHALFPENGDVLRAISQVQLDQRQWERAKATLLKAKAVVEEGRAAKEVLLQLAYVYDKTDQVDQVETLLREAIAQYPDDAQVYNFLGYTYADRNIKLEEAQSLIEKACQLNPNDGNIVDSLGWLYYRQGRYKEAIEQLERANQLEQDHPVILDHLGDALLKDGRIEDAVASWKKSLECGPDFPTEFTPEFQRQVSSKIKEAEKLNQP